jgi:GNAT superfamily N-acetyltransferase
VIDPVRACALADARFHDLCFGALDIPVHRTATHWWVRRPASTLLMYAGTLDASATSSAVLDTVAEVPAVTAVRDCWGRLDLAPAGFGSEVDDPWMVRPPGPLTVAQIPGLRIRRAVTAEDVLEFERTATSGTGDPPPPGHHDGAIHPGRASARVADLHLFTGYLDGHPVATSLAAVHPEVVMIGAVRTHPDARRRGIGTAMTAAAVAVAADRPAALGARPLGVPVYRAMGFVECGHALLWTRPAPGPR